MELTTEMILFIAAGGLLLIILIALLIWRIRSVRSVHTQEPIPQTGGMVSSRPARIEGSEPRLGPTFEELNPGPPDENSASSTLQTAAYNLRIEKIQDQLRYTVNGVTYRALEEIPDPELRKMAARLQEKTMRGQALGWEQQEALRQVWIGDQKTIEARSPEHTISVQNTGRTTRFIINGMTYYDLKEIVDPDMRAKVKELMDKMV